MSLKLEDVARLENETGRTNYEECWTKRGEQSPCCPGIRRSYGPEGSSGCVGQGGGFTEMDESDELQDRVKSGFAVLSERSVANLPGCGQAAAADKTTAKGGVGNEPATNENEVTIRRARATNGESSVLRASQTRTKTSYENKWDKSTGVAADGESSVPSYGDELGTNEVDKYEVNEYELDEEEDVVRCQ
ncbi:hypothetical protein PC129_g22289 [Phytophthora cactorum]|uniref:Uncharacterized protein n=1 Tax=Phytophthora cactorum TaxID=29920 RepID=A0A329RQZ7_9STRA|nr:hypothetical protein Pcac1_g14198 [Phytophthora cactorum]KAG2794776.1 hypothetical protein PC111_g22443 [Phytophthora cactorum]KAG2812096.1 hypothetical protein PC112_g15327 [Phytophthora cactorum]KAG2853016.1 hypothetical protein PC113_g14529 [Phytophthora cactorum]KAG2883890.1 hypothetical protein PC114_g20380 [Phytophthora cactorum]